MTRIGNPFSCVTRNSLERARSSCAKPTDKETIQALLKRLTPKEAVLTRHEKQRILDHLGSYARNDILGCLGIGGYTSLSGSASNVVDRKEEFFNCLKILQRHRYTTCMSNTKAYTSSFKVALLMIAYTIVCDNTSLFNVQEIKPSELWEGSALSEHERTNFFTAMNNQLGITEDALRKVFQSDLTDFPVKLVDGKLNIVKRQWMREVYRIAVPTASRNVHQNSVQPTDSSNLAAIMDEAQSGPPKQPECSANRVEDWRNRAIAPTTKTGGAHARQRPKKTHNDNSPNSKKRRPFNQNPMHARKDPDGIHTKTSLAK